ncbi:hypothetical protein D8B26_007287 [Coccidioides posadasii str. Silveira]|uniref:uncharacterized protein n=1 Tax=Coccidioides posadasii (strain RMSCC 757 / Silveira) TaxID=443226 RepID=UPI001BEE0F30|nr:hypothetical protein D8B26_007287 [Coccidioides posadasii str. Silveira]
MASPPPSDSIFNSFSTLRPPPQETHRGPLFAWPKVTRHQRACSAMSSTEAEPRSTIAINDDTDAETDAPRSPPRELRRTSRLMDNSLPEYEALFDGRAILNSSASTRGDIL